MLKIKRIFPTYQRFRSRLFIRHICTRQCSFLTIFIVKLKNFSQLRVIIWITKTAQRITVEQNTIILIRNDKRNRNLCIILEKLFVLSFIIELFRLMLSQSIKSLILRRLKHLTDRISFCTLYFDRSECLSSTFIFLKNHFAILIRKPDFTGRTQDKSLDFFCRNCDGIPLLRNGKRCLFFLRYDNQAL